LNTRDFDSSSPRSNFVLHHTEATGHKFYQTHQEAAAAQS